MAGGTGVLCDSCGERRAAMRRPKTLERFCRACFVRVFEDEVHRTIVEHQLFRRGERVALGASGGKDSTVLIHVLKTLNDRYDYGLDLYLLSIDEGIRGYRDDSLATVAENSKEYQLPLKILSYDELYGGWTMDKVVSEVGLKSNCTFCGVFRRQALDRGAMLIKADKVATGHNADDIAETVVLNLVRGDIARLGRCTSIVTGSEGESAFTLPRCKPLKYAYEKEIVLYAYFNKLTYFSTECVYAPQATRGFAREFIKDLEAIRPKTILRLIESAENLRLSADSNSSPSQSEHACEICGYLTSQKICKACVLLDGLNAGNPRAGLRKNANK